MSHDESPSGRTRPPSFTPQSGRSTRPPSANDAIAVGSDGSRQASRHDEEPISPDVPLSAEPRIKRQSSRSTPVSPPRRGTPPAAIPARPVGTRSADQRAGTPVTDRRSTATGADAPPSVPPAAGRSPRPSGATRSTTQQPQSPRRSAPASAGSRPRPVPAGGRRPAPRPGGGRPSPDRLAGPSRPGRSGVRVRKGRLVATAGILVLVLLLAWPVGLLVWANGKIQHVDALSGAPGTPGQTYLLAGSDARGEGISEDGTEGARTDTILLLHKPRSGPVSLISLPRDTFVDIPGKGPAKLNAAYSWGGAPLLVQTVEGLTGLSVDHYVEIGFGGVEGIVDSLGGVELCLDQDVDDPRSELVWTAGCHPADGHTALAFSRMRYSDVKGDIGRAERQRQVIGAVSKKAADKSLLLKPGTQVSLIDAGLGSLVVDESSGIIDLGRMALAFRAANGPDGVTGTPPISDPDYRPGGIGSTVRLDPDLSPAFWSDLRDGKLPAGVVGGLPG